MKALRTLYPTLALPPKARFSLGVSFISGIISLFRLASTISIDQIKKLPKKVSDGTKLWNDMIKGWFK